MTSHGAFMMIGVIITQLQSSLREQLTYYQLADMSSPAKDEMESILGLHNPYISFI